MPPRLRPWVRDTNVETLAIGSTALRVLAYRARRVQRHTRLCPQPRIPARLPASSISSAAAGKHDAVPHSRELKLGCVVPQSELDSEDRAVRGDAATAHTGAIEDTESAERPGRGPAPRLPPGCARRRRGLADTERNRTSPARSISATATTPAIHENAANVVPEARLSSRNMFSLSKLQNRVPRMGYNSQGRDHR